ncbi:UNVERIFIED_CONTAM: hypothetical protein HDU68_008018 [Siphonaria sp. JEL0065]|nr:hypothetical protein HDU68_008018 [Siphonaria sp. JEL0065]
MSSEEEQRKAVELRMVELQERIAQALLSQQASMVELQRLDAKQAAVMAENETLKGRIAKIESFEENPSARPCTFPANSTPLKDIQIAYRTLPGEVLTPEQLVVLDGAVVAGNFNPILEIFNELANSDEFGDNELIHAINAAVADHERSPNVYASDDEASVNALFL